jgi:hypothetical protein
MKNYHFFLLVVLIAVSDICHSQNILIKTYDLDVIKINKALAIIYKYEPDIFESTIKHSNIQFGEFHGQDGTSFAIDEKNTIGHTLWIMLSQSVVKKESVNWVAATILHEAMHLRYSVSIPITSEISNYASREKLEHTTIYNYELMFLKRIGANANDISDLKVLMKSLSISII